MTSRRLTRPPYGLLVLLGLWAASARAFAQLPDAPAPPSANPEEAETAPDPAAPPSSEPPPAPPDSRTPKPAYPPLSPPPDGYAPDETPSGYGPETGSPLRIPTRIAARMRTLETDLNLLAARGGGRIADGVVSLIAGSAFFTIALFIDDPLFRSLLFMTSGVAVGRGIIDLAVVPDPKDYAIEYSHMPMTSVEQVRARLGYGERALETLARRNRTARMLEGTLAIASGGTTIAVFVARPPCPSGMSDCRFKDDPLNYIIIVGGGISIIGGLVSLLAKSEAERRWNAYRKLRDRLRDESHGQARQLELALPSFAPLPGGAGVRWGLRF